MGVPTDHVKQRRGFAAMSRERQQELCSKGGKAVQALGTAHRWTKDSARAAGRKGGLARARKAKEG